MTTPNIMALANRRTKRRKSSAFHEALSCLGRYEAFIGPAGIAYVSLFSNGRCQTYSVQSSDFTDRLTMIRVQQGNAPLRPNVVANVQQQLRAEALLADTSTSAALRVGRCGNQLYIDLCDSEWRSVVITRDEIRVGHQSEIRFIRHAGMLPLPVPDLDGDLNELRAVLGTVDEATWHLYAGAVLAAYHPSGPYPVLVISGAHRSGKTRASLLFRALVDPSRSPLRSLPRTQDDLWVAAQNERLLAFDNVSRVSNEQSDELCRVSTGGGSSTRQFYSNSAQVLFDAKRPILINGIAPELTRPDLIDRAVFIYMPQIPPDQALPEADLDRMFLSSYARIFGGICKALQCALRNEDTAVAPCDGRLIDMVRWVSGTEEASGWSPGTFATAYSNNYREARMSLLQDNSLFSALTRLLDQHRGEWSGTATGLLSDLSSIPVMCDANWPRSPRQTRERLTRIEPFLGDAGVSISYTKATSPNRDRIITLRHTDTLARIHSEEASDDRVVPFVRDRVRSRFRSSPAPLTG